MYSEKTWVLNEDGGFERERVSSKGIIVLSTDIQSIELFEHP